MIIIINWEPIEAQRITLDEATHTYLVDGVKVENSVSVTELIHGKFEGIPNNHMINGTLVHARVPFFLEALEEDIDIAKSKITNDIDKQAFLLAKYHHETIGSADNEFEKRLGVELELFDDEENCTRKICMFGSVDCVSANGFISEFKTSTKHYKYHETQVLLYRFMYEATYGICPGIYSISFGGAVSHGHIQRSTVHTLIAQLFTKYYDKDKEAKQIDPKGFDFYESQTKIQQLEKMLKEEKEKRDKALEQLGIVEPGTFELGRNVVLKRNKVTRSGIDTDLVRQKMPEALTFKEFYTNIFTIREMD